MLMGAGPAARAQWQAQNITFGVDPSVVKDLSIVNANVVFAVAGGGGSSQVGYSAFSRTNDGGATWVRSTVPYPIVGAPVYAGVSAVDANNVWVAFYNVNTITSAAGGGYVLYSRNGGTTWTYQSTAAFAGSTSFLNDLHMFDVSNGVVVGNPSDGSFEVYTTANSGTQWMRVPAANLPAPLTSETGTVGVLTAVGSSAWFGTNFGRVYASTDRGLTWQVGDTHLPEVKKLAFSDALNGLALYNDAATGTITLSRTADGGRTWTVLTPTGRVFGSGLASVPGRPGTFVSTGLATASAGSSRTTDYGLTWTTIDQGTPRGTVAFYDAQTGWAGGIYHISGGGIYRSVPTLLASRPAAANPLSAQVVPNPVPDGRLRVQLPAGSPVKDLILLNALGQPVLARAVPAAPAGTTLDLDVSGLPAGVYLLRTTGGPEANAIQRVVLL